MREDFVLEAVSREMMERISREESKDKNFEDIIKEIDFRELCSDVVENLSKEAVEFYMHNMSDYLHKEKTKNHKFLINLDKKYHETFALCETMYIMVKEAAEDYCGFVNNLDENIVKNKESLFISLREIHGRACQQYDEILCLIKNGFADGALSRWRSLYELSVIAYFIAEKGEKTAASFISQAISNDRYDWARAAGCFENNHRHISFTDIIHNCSFETDKWRGIYNTANKLVHASPQGTFDRLSRGSSDRSYILAGRSDYGLALPAQASAISLNVVNEIFLSLFPNGRSALAVNYINKWTDLICNEYSKKL